MDKNYDMGKDLDFYIEHQDEFVSKYSGKYIVISRQKLFGAYSSLDDAIKNAKKKIKPGEFMVQLVGPGEENYTGVISRVRFYG